MLVGQGGLLMCRFAKSLRLGAQLVRLREVRIGLLPVAGSFGGQTRPTAFAALL